MKTIRNLLETGMENHSGGLLSGMLYIVLEWALSSAGALIVLLLLTFAAIMVACRITPMMLIDMFRPPEYEYEDEEERARYEEPVQLPNVHEVAREINAAHAQKREERRARRQASDFDIPIDSNPPGEDKPGGLELSTFLSIVIFSLGLVGPIIAAFTFTDDLAVLGTNVEEISQLLNAEELNHKETPIKLEDTGISLRSVSFSYDGTTEVLHDVNLAIHPGTMTALVGPSGSGKSTVAKLIAGYWDVTSGSITLGGHELKDMPLSEIADQISYVSQDNYLFNRSIRENIRMGRPSATDAEVEQAAKQSGCDAFIRKLDNGYDTVVGSAGSHLSGGERQRIAIARAMLKNAPVVILDEATAYIDPENEALVQKAISTLTVGKTLIVIAHRLSTIVGADNIVVVKDGTIHAQGTHEKLLETCPLYRDMWQAHIGAKDQM